MSASLIQTTLLAIFFFLLTTTGASPSSRRPPNVVFILVDDLRHDTLGFTGHPFVETPHIDQLAQTGVVFENAFVTTSLCSPSRASFLTGQYMHRHGVIDNETELRSDAPTFPALLQKGGYTTAFIGKWHMGGASDEPRPGFDHWVSFRGQGSYSPEGQMLNVDGRRVAQEQYMTDALTGYAIDWLNERDPSRPWLLYLSHKAVHGPYDPPPRHRGRYTEAQWNPPDSATADHSPDHPKPMWVRNQRNSWHGIDFPYHGAYGLSIESMVKGYAEMIFGIDESVGRIMQTLHAKGLHENTLVIFTSDGGHLWGEHGLIDKRSAYEASIRIPLVAWGPSITSTPRHTDALVRNIDVAPTLLELAGQPVPPEMQGRGFLDQLTGDAGSSTSAALLYEYYWEPAFPQTPTMFALRDSRFKLIQYHGVWDMDELYDLEADPGEVRNLVFDRDHQERVDSMRQRLLDLLDEAGGRQIPVGVKRNHGNSLRRADGAPRAEFPDRWVRD